MACLADRSGSTGNSLCCSVGRYDSTAIVQAYDVKGGGVLALVADRVAREEYQLTHDFLSIMLGVRRATVSEAAKHHHDAGAIE